MMPGLLEGQEKMSKSDPNSAIFMEDSEADVSAGQRVGRWGRSSRRVAKWQEQKVVLRAERRDSIPRVQLGMDSGRHRYGVFGGDISGGRGGAHEARGVAERGVHDHWAQCSNWR